MNPRLPHEHTPLLVSLSLARALSNKDIRTVLGAIDIESFYTLRSADLCDLGLTCAKADAFTKSIREVYTRNKALADQDIHAVSILDSFFPMQLTELRSCPYVLYYRGSNEAFSKAAAVSVVGTRKPTAYGKAACLSIVRDIASHDVVIVSGLAYGIDALAHQAAIEAGALTVAFLGCGIDTVYPKANESLAEAILAAGGAIVSEYPPETPALKQHFPARNRLVAGFSQVTIVVEGAVESGSLITADFARDVGRIVGAIPGEISNPMAKGPHSLIKAGAVVVTEFDDLAKFLKSESLTGEERLAYIASMNEHEQSIYALLSAQDLGTDAIVRSTQMSVTQVQGLLTNLELEGVIEKVGDVYQLRS